MWMGPSSGGRDTVDDGSSIVAEAAVILLIKTSPKSEKHGRQV
jgi:hypothetical protein